MLAQATWTCGSTSPGAVSTPGELDGAAIEWLPATVPGTAAGALRDAGRWAWGTEDEEILDGRDWWFRCRFPGPNLSSPGGGGPWELHLGGVATLADVWLGASHLLHSENMFLAHRLGVERLEPDNELAIRCAALSPVLGARHPRPRWKSRLVRSQSLRWYRTTLLGRMPGWSRWAAPVGPWRPIRLVPRTENPAPLRLSLQTGCDANGRGGTVSVRAVLRRGAGLPKQAHLRVGGESVRLGLEQTGTEVVAQGTLHLDIAERWWPHTQGAQPLYDAELELDGARSRLRRVGFRTLELDREDGAFRLRVNGLAVFCRGALWSAPDAVSLAAGPEEVRASVALAREAGMNMLRVPGYATYEDEPFWNACDELGVLVWQDCMLARMDPPEEADFVAGLEQELQQAFGSLQGRPALAIACGSSETYQQASMYGLAPERRQSNLLERTIPALLQSLTPGVPYVASAPSGSEPPFAPEAGVSHYFGVGGYLRPPADARLAGVRFAAECLAFGTPPERETVEQVFGGAGVAGHDPRWKQAVARDTGASWDFEDVRDHYVRELFAVDPLQVRYADPERALDLGRAAVAELMSLVLTEWRRRASSCDGALVLSWRDLWPGAGWGLLDSFGRPKASFYAVRRVSAPSTVLISDEGLSGLRLHVFNDGPERLVGRVRLRVFSDAGAELETGERDLEIDAHGALDLRADALLDGFRDLNHVYRFGPLGYDVVAAELYDAQDRLLGVDCHLVSGPARPRLADLGLTAQANRGPGGEWSLRVSSTLFAHYVAFEVPGFRPSDSWFHLLPGSSATVALHCPDPERRPAGSVRALNSSRTEQIEVRTG